MQSIIVKVLPRQKNHSLNEFLRGIQRVINAFQKGIFSVRINFSFSNDPEKKLLPESPRTPTTPPEGIGIKILPSKQLLQRLPILLAQLHAGNTSENLLNEVRQIVYSL